MNVKELLSTMTVKEKVGQLNQRLYGWNVYEKKDGQLILTDYFKTEVERWGSIGAIYGVFRADPWSGKNQETGLSLKEAKVVSQMIQDYLKTTTRLGIPALLSEECPHGHQGIDSTTTPVNFLSGCSWNPEIYQRIQEIVGQEINEKGAHLGLISTLDVLRDPRWGRSEECFSEDPYLTSQFTIAAVKGLQKQTSLFPQVGAVVKHLAGQGNAMGGHNSGAVHIGKRELLEIHLPAVETAVISGASAFMAAYNDIDGIPCHANKELLTEYLREALHFSGIVMADGCALDRLADFVENPVKAAAGALTSGIDLNLWDNVYPYLEEAVKTNMIDEKELDQAVLRVLELKKSLGLFAKNDEFEKVTIDKEKQEKRMKKLNIQLVKEGSVLLKNNNVLPLNRESKLNVLVVGPHGDNIYHHLGDYTPYKDLENVQSILQSLTAYTQSSQITIDYEKGSNISTEIPQGAEKAYEKAKKADVIIFTLGGSSARDFSTEFDANGAALSGSTEMTSGENIDLANLALPQAQISLVHKLKELEKPMIGILIEGRPHTLEEVHESLDSILFVGYPGQYGGAAIAEMIFGESPNGRLAFSIPITSSQLPVYYNYRNTMFKEDYADISGKPRYAFGYGLSYTTFKMENPQFKYEKEKFEITVKIKNIGSFDAKETIQVYVKKNQELVAPREKELVGFKKIFLKQGEEKSIQLTINKREFMYFDEKFQRQLPEKLMVTVESSSDTYRMVLE